MGTFVKKSKGMDQAAQKWGGGGGGGMNVSPALERTSPWLPLSCDKCESGCGAPWGKRFLTSRALIARNVGNRFRHGVPRHLNFFDSAHSQINHRSTKGCGWTAKVEKRGATQENELNFIITKTSVIPIGATPVSSLCNAKWCFDNQNVIPRRNNTFRTLTLFVKIGLRILKFEIGRHASLTHVRRCGRRVRSFL